jgi:hypothetical protein
MSNAGAEISDRQAEGKLAKGGEATRMRPTVVPLSSARIRDPRIPRAIEARRRLGRPTGRAWVNGREVGGVDQRYAHLGRSHD